MRYLAFIHGDEGLGFGISFPDFAGCVSDGGTVEDAIRHGSEALSFHVEGLIGDGEAIPPPLTVQEIKADPSLTEWREGADIAVVSLIIDRGSPRRVNVFLDYGLLQAIDDEVRSRGMTRTAFLCRAARNEVNRPR